jgi:hypothetical protein
VTEDGLEETALHAAAAGGSEAVVRLLVSAGAAVDAANADGARPKASLACCHDPHSTQIVGLTPLHLAAGRRCAAAVQELLSAGADPNAAARQQRTPLTLAVGSTLAFMESVALSEFLSDGVERAAPFDTVYVLLRAGQTLSLERESEKVGYRVSIVSSAHCADTADRSWCLG